MSLTGPVVLGVDLGTTKIVALAIDVGTGNIVASHSLLNDAAVTSDADRAGGRSEWNAERIVSIGVQCLAGVARRLGERVHQVAGIGITGQQHGMLIADDQNRPLTPLINWQDRRGLDVMPGEDRSYLEVARTAMGPQAARRAGCVLQPGFMALTLFWFKQRGMLPARSHACFIMDHFASYLTGERAAADPSCGGSAGVLDVRLRQWQNDAIRALDLSPDFFPQIREADQVVGSLTGNASAASGLPRGTPVFVPIGDHQASFIGSVDDREQCALVNVGTGAQVAAFTDGFEFEPPIELRPFPISGNLLSNVGLAGGWSYQVLETFFQDVFASFATDSTTSGSDEKLYQRMNELAGLVPPGANGLTCRPTFAGTRSDPTLLGEFQGIAVANFTAAHFCRAVLEGMAAGYRQAYEEISAVLGRRHACFTGAGNALRTNRVLLSCLEGEFRAAVRFTSHQEEAAFGAGLVAATGLAIFPSLPFSWSNDFIRLTPIA